MKPATRGAAPGLGMTRAKISASSAETRPGAASPATTKQAAPVAAARAVKIQNERSKTWPREMRFMAPITNRTAAPRDPGRPADRTCETARSSAGRRQHSSMYSSPLAITSIVATGADA